MVGNRLGYQTYVLQAGAFLAGPLGFCFYMSFSYKIFGFSVFMLQNTLLCIFIVKSQTIGECSIRASGKTGFCCQSFDYNRFSMK